MKRIILMLMSGILSSTVFGQYVLPYRIAFNPDSKAYVISNSGNGSIIQLDSSYNTKTVITGLSEPRDLAFASFAGTTGLLVVDNNQIIVYNATNYQKIISYTVSGVKNLGDIEIDPYNTGYFYLSDKGNNQILKGKVGSPPYYTPTYKVLSSDKVPKPNGLLFDRKGRLLVVSDSIGGKVFQIDTSSGVASLLTTTGVDALNHIAEDKEGNYYLTNWSNSNLYRTDGNFSNLTKLTTYNKPAGMYVNVETDIMLIACHLCSKVDFHKLHLIEPKQAVEYCMRDSFAVDIDIQYNGIGTYLSGNNFLIELSDANGSFAKPTTIGSVATTDKPTEIRGYLPKGQYGSNHKYRIRSTNPSFASQPLDFTVLSTPIISDFLADSVFACKGSEVNLGKINSNNFDFNWRPGTMLNDSTVSSPEFNAISSGIFKFQLTAMSKDGNCADSGEVVVEVTPEIKLNPWQRIRETCANQPISIGGNQHKYEYSWFPSSQLNDSTSANPLFKGEMSQKYLVSVRDTNSGCSGFDSVDVTVHAYPKMVFNQNEVVTCVNQLVEFGVSSDSDAIYKWFFPKNLVDTSGSEVSFKSNQSGSFKQLLRVTNKAGCASDTFINVENVALPTFSDFRVDALTLSWPKDIRVRINTDLQNQVEIMWDSNEVDFISFGFLNESRDSVFVKAETGDVHNFIALVTNPQGCVTMTDTLESWMIWDGVTELLNANIKVYPNPVITDLIIENPDGNISFIALYDATGKLIYEKEWLSTQTSSSVKMTEFPAGNYFLKIEGRSGKHFLKIVKS